ncbi:MAG: biopolymer transporter ExbD, partial [Erythrobacter sp.]|uniref:ExbD/TolR family protein n=1 Tax=Erythrobacter sp. TaxID=1042 RepID=UPI0025E9D06A
RFDHGEPIRAIDTRPLLFVALFIAVVFLLAASQSRTHALLLELPQPEAGLNGTGLLPIVYRVEVTASGELRFNGEVVDAQQLQVLLAEVSTLEPRAVLAFEPDGDAPYDLAAHTLAIIHRAGVNDEWFCINGMEKHGEFGKSGGHPLPLLTSIRIDQAMGAQRMVPPPAIDTCAPELFGTTGR